MCLTQREISWDCFHVLKLFCLNLVYYDKDILFYNWNILKKGLAMITKAQGSEVTEKFSVSIW